MIIGVPKEIKNHEYRVGMVPASVRELTARNHTVFVQSGAGNGIGFSDTDYIAVGAELVWESTQTGVGTQTLGWRMSTEIIR